MRALVLDGFGVDFIKQIWSENPRVWIDEFGDEVVDLITEAVELEKITPTRRVLTKYLTWVPSSSPSTSNTSPAGALDDSTYRNSTGLTIRSRGYPGKST